jgi:hypothetical protein
MVVRGKAEEEKREAGGSEGDMRLERPQVDLELSGRKLAS